MCENSSPEYLKQICNFEKLKKVNNRPRGKIRPIWSPWWTGATLQAPGGRFIEAKQMSK
jgi:hypothetical protein